MGIAGEKDILSQDMLQSGLAAVPEVPCMPGQYGQEKSQTIRALGGL